MFAIWMFGIQILNVLFFIVLLLVICFPLQPVENSLLENYFFQITSFGIEIPENEIS